LQQELKRLKKVVQIQLHYLDKTSKRTPPTFENKELIYPVDYTVENYVHFTIDPRKKRDEETQGTETTHIYLYAPNIQDNAPGVSYKNLEYGNVARGLMDSERVFSSEMSDALSAEFSEAVAKSFNRIALNTRDFQLQRTFNPQLEIMFDGMTFRTFDMQFQFRPNSQLEADKVREIIYELKTAMLPDAFQLKEGNNADEFSENYFNRPNLFNIEYVGPIADKVDGFLPAFLTACNVTYNGGGKMETFTDGTPLIIDMTLSFQEKRNYDSRKISNNIFICKIIFSRRRKCRRWRKCRWRSSSSDIYHRLTTIRKSWWFQW
jgi:hypothetical protein